LIRPLNFHRGLDRGPADFLHKAASATIVIEVLRYGRMRAPDAAPPFTADDFMSQHELLVRIIVGRVDDDTAQAHQPALFVPAIFVDNPWSKALGRRLQGYPKMLAEFRAGPNASDLTTLDMTGCAREPRPRKRPFTLEGSRLREGAFRESLTDAERRG